MTETGRTSPPRVSTTDNPSPAIQYMIRDPSGDHAGLLAKASALSNPGYVKNRCPVPSTAARPTMQNQSKLHILNAMRPSTGDHVSWCTSKSTPVT